MRDRAELGQSITRARRLEGYGAGEDAAVDLRQGDMHRKVGGTEAARRRAPGVEPGAREDHLQHRRVDPIENGPVAFVEPGGERGGVEHNVERLALDERPKGRERRLVLEAGHIDARGRESLGAHRLGQRLDRLEIVGEIDGAIEDDQRVRRAPLSLEAGPIETAEGADRRGGRGGRRGADLAAEKGEAGLHVLRPAFVEITPDLLDRAPRKRRSLHKARVGAPVAGQQRQPDAAAARQRRQFVDAVAPIVCAAEHTRDHQAG